MFTLVVPLKPVPPPQDVTEEELQKIFIKKDENMFRMSIPNLLARTFVMPDSENPLTTVELDQLPNTLTGNMGFFLGWFFWLGMIFTPILWLRAGHRGRPKGSHEEQFQRRLHGFILVVIWFFAVIAAFATGAPLGEVRYLNYAYIPATLLIGFMIRLIEDAFLLRLPARTWFAIVVSVLVGFTILQNIKFLKKWVCHFGGMQHAISESEKIIHTSFFGQTPAGMVLYNRHGELEERAVLVLWYELPADWFDQAMDRLQRENVLFVKTREESDPKLERFRDRGREVEKLAVISLDDAKPAIFRVQRWLEQAGLRRSKNRNVFVFKIR